MRRVWLVPLFLLFATALPALAAPPADSASGGPGPGEPSPPAVRPQVPAVPFLLDPLDLGFGSSVVFTRIPRPSDLSDLAYIANVSHVVLSLPAWPEGWEALRTLQSAPLPEGADLVVLLPGYPPSRQAAEAWNYLRKPLRLILIVDGPPADRSTILELNAIRGLERIIADMPEPSRSGFERLQRPLSFRVVRP